MHFTNINTGIKLWQDGFALLEVNFRGSVGHGEANVESIATNMGKYDVADCLLAIGGINVMKGEVIDRRQVFLYGKSYGGYVVTALSAQYPDMFRAVVARCPLIDLVSKFNYADNPDSCAVEAGYPFTEKGPLTEQFLLDLRRVSPLVHAHKVKTPTAIMLGSIDKRVPYYQGLEYYRRIKANGCKAKLYLYEDNHALSTLPVEMDNLINSVAWFIEHID